MAAKSQKLVGTVEANNPARSFATPITWDAIPMQTLPALRTLAVEMESHHIMRALMVEDGAEDWLTRRSFPVYRAESGERTAGI